MGTLFTLVVLHHPDLLCLVHHAGRARNCLLYLELYGEYSVGGDKITPQLNNKLTLLI